MPWTCRKDRPPIIHRRGGGGSGALMRRRHQVHPTDTDGVQGRRVWKNLFPVDGRSICDLIKPNF